MRLINADKLKDEIWLSPICLRDEQKQIAMTMVDEAKTVEAVPLEFIRKLITDPDNAGRKSSVLSWLFRKWEEEKNGWNTD